MLEKTLENPLDSKEIKPVNLKEINPEYSLEGQPRQHIIKQRHYFANKGLSSQVYGFPSSHVWMDVRIGL